VIGIEIDHFKLELADGSGLGPTNNRRAGILVELLSFWQVIYSGGYTFPSSMARETRWRLFNYITLITLHLTADLLNK